MNAYAKSLKRLVRVPGLAFDGSSGNSCYFRWALAEWMSADLLVTQPLTSDKLPSPNSVGIAIDLLIKTPEIDDKINAVLSGTDYEGWASPTLIRGGFGKDDWYLGAVRVFEAMGDDALASSVATELQTRLLPTWGSVLNAKPFEFHGLIDIGMDPQVCACKWIGAHLTGSMGKWGIRETTIAQLGVATSSGNEAEQRGRIAQFAGVSAKRVAAILELLRLRAAALGGEDAVKGLRSVQ